MSGNSSRGSLESSRHTPCAVAYTAHGVCLLLSERGLVLLGQRLLHLAHERIDLGPGLDASLLVVGDHLRDLALNLRDVRVHLVGADEWPPAPEAGHHTPLPL